MNRSSRRILGGIGLLVLLGIGAAYWWLRPPSPLDRPRELPVDGTGGRWDRETTQQWIEQRNTALGLLENHRFEEASIAWETLRTQLPTERTVVQNLTICRVKLATEAIDERAEPDRFARAMDEAERMLATCEQVLPDSAVPLFLSAVLSVKRGLFSEAAQRLKRATDRDPTQAAWWFQRFELGRLLRDPAEKEAAFAAGLIAADRAPDNLFVQKEILAEMLTRQIDLARRSSAEASPFAAQISQRLEQFREPLRVVGISVQVQAGIDVVAIFDQVVAAVAEQNWLKARNEFLKIKNLLAQETAADADQMHPHPLTYHDPLNYVALDFSPEFYLRADFPEETLPQIPVDWVAVDGFLPVPPEDVRCLNSVDFDLDGIEDVMALAPRSLHVYRRQTDPPGWDDVQLDLPGDFSAGLLAADLDDDVVDLGATRPGELGPVTPEHCHEADPDFVVFGVDGVLVIKNVHDSATQQRRLEAVPPETTGFQNLRQVTHCQLTDFDHDGDLDVIALGVKSKSFAELQLWINLGNFTFRDAADRSVLPPESCAVSSFAMVDWDQDNDVDVLVSGPDWSGWMENLRHGRLRFREIGGFWPSARQIAVAELNGRGGWELILADADGVRIVFSEQPLQGLPKLVDEKHLIGAKAFTTSLIDYDQDGGLDLLASDLPSLGLWRNSGQGIFERQPTTFGDSEDACQQVALGNDFDRDGDLDIIAAVNGSWKLWRNDGGHAHQHVQVRIRAQQVKANEQGASKRVNHYGIGSLVELKSGTRYQAQLAAQQTVRFGLGAKPTAEILRVVMTNGVPQNRIEPRGNELVCERQVLLTSCPFVYAWNGNQFDFYTDLLWAAPLGLNAGETDLVPWRDWEYLKIDGDKLHPKDGEYLLQVTEELWEAAYFDHVRLFAVDHPRGTQIFTNEKVGPPTLAEHKIHTVREPRHPISARDQAGRDWLTEVSSRDEVYTRTFTRKIAQGLCEEHFLELDLGELTDPSRIVLFLTGWIRPTDTNINVALDQHPEWPTSSGLALWAPDEKGNWREVSPHVGFPNGKTKTIAIDLSQAFVAGRHQLRLVSNREFYWDQAFFTADDEPVEIRESELPLRRAHLHDRGFSRGVLPIGDGPETYDYGQLATLPPWPAMDGRFTRFGDVLPLLQRRDDLLVVLAPGDELSLAFGPSPEPLPPGWARDFVMYNVGWDKDGLLNTWEGQRPEPLPFAGMLGHDYWTGRPDSTTGAYAEYIRNYQTRQQRNSFWTFVQRWKTSQGEGIPRWEHRRTGD